MTNTNPQPDGVLVRLDYADAQRIAEAKSAAPLYWLDAPECQAMIDDLANLCQELAAQSRPTLKLLAS